MAAAWYVLNGRVHPAPTQGQAMLAMVRAGPTMSPTAKTPSWWPTTATRWRDSTRPPAGVGRTRPSFRARAGGRGREALPGRRPGGHAFARTGRCLGDLAAGGGQLVDLATCSLVAVTPEGTELHMGTADIWADRLAHAYSVSPPLPGPDRGRHLRPGRRRRTGACLRDHEQGQRREPRARGRPRPSSSRPPPGLGLGPGTPPAVGPRRVTEERLARLYHERQELRGLIPPDRSADLDQAVRQLRAVEQDTADLRAGTGRWAHSIPGAAARELHQAAVSYQRASKDLEVGNLGPWGRHKAAVNERVIGSLRRRQAGLGAARPTICRPAGSDPGTATRQADELEKAQQAREAFLAKHPDVRPRLVEFGRAIEHEQEVQPGQSYRRVLQREQARHLRTSRVPDTGRGIEM